MGGKVKTIYIAGPMRHYPQFNFPAFDAARDAFTADGWRVISPADIDREHGIDPNTPRVFSAAECRELARRDIAAILESDAIAMLPGWERSAGASAELAVAKWIGLEVYDATTRKVMDESILDEAKRITRGDRNYDYGHPAVEHDRIAAYWTTYLNRVVRGEDVAMMMVLLKVARMGERYKRDNLVDMAGYADCYQRIHCSREEKRTA